MEIVLKRTYLGEDYTIGNMYIGGKYYCDTLEDTVRDKKIKGKTAIPIGRYEVILSMSAKFKRVLPQLLYVNGFTGVRIHRGNDESDTEGCILIGKNKVKGKVINSTEQEMDLIEKMLRADKINITIL